MPPATPKVRRICDPDSEYLSTCEVAVQRFCSWSSKINVTQGRGQLRMKEALHTRGMQACAAQALECPLCLPMPGVTCREYLQYAKCE